MNFMHDDGRTLYDNQVSKEGMSYLSYFPLHTWITIFNSELYGISITYIYKITVLQIK